MDTPLENEEDGALKLTLPKESYDLDRDSQDLPEEFEKAATYGENENESCILIFKRRVEEKASLLNYTIDNIYARPTRNNLFGILSSR
ncbi:hypothetical protein KY284_033328 [Solanum tuberosum]|nr:hypothetical protein KY284_033328 [Solanum tuberosum]